MQFIYHLRRGELNYIIHFFYFRFKKEKKRKVGEGGPNQSPPTYFLILVLKVNKNNLGGELIHFLRAISLGGWWYPPQK